jgi:uncharacterized protein (TIGR02421 family)
MMISKRMSTKTKKSLAKSRRAIPGSLTDVICQRLARNLSVRRALPVNGRLHIDRQLPFLCVYRQPPDHEDAGTDRLVKGEASYLVVSGDSRLHKSISNLVRKVVETLSGQFGAFLIVEIWAAPDGGQANDAAVPAVLPTFTVHAPASAAITRTVETLERRLKRVKVLKQGVEIAVFRDGKSHPPNLRPLLTSKNARELNCSCIGLVVPPVYRKPNSQEEFPLLGRALRRSLSLALRQTYFEFALSRTTHRPPHYHALGRRAVVKAVWDVDRQLAAVSNQFDYLLLLTPVNTSSAWKRFERRRYERAPEFHYPPVPFDPALLKRELYKIVIERVEDPALQRLFQEKREELELKLTMLRDRDTPRLLYESLHLFGGVQDRLLKSAVELLNSLASQAHRKKGPEITAHAFAKCAEAEFDLYRQSCPEFNAKAQVTSKVSGLIVSRGKLLISPDLALPSSRINALLAHEVGTHLLTYFNGRLQPFQQLYSGLAGYEELQEGLAVLAEYLVGGLSRGRMRQLAARVVAVRHLTDGASFVDTFRALCRDYRFNKRAAFGITMRVYRGGGLTKDAIYLRGLETILQYVKKGGDLNPLLTGKMAAEHIPIIKELQYRKVLVPAPIVPRYLEDPVAVERLERLRGGDHSVADLVIKDLPKRGVTV